MRTVDLVVVHCSDSPVGTVETIRAFHVAPPPIGRGWRDVGYHYVIGNGRAGASAVYDLRLDGIVWPGRDLDRDGDVDEEVGAHAAGDNARSLGVCLVGRDRFTVRQFAALLDLLDRKRRLHGVPVERVVGHRELTSGRLAGKTCPNIDPGAIRALLAVLGPREDLAGA